MVDIIGWWNNYWNNKQESDEKSNQRRISDQSILMANIEKIISSEKYRSLQTGPLSLGYKIDNSEVSINKLYNFSDFIEEYRKLTPADLSNLVPYIEIYKIYPEEDGEPTYRIPFNNFFPKKAQDSILANGSDRGYQANLVGVEFISQGKDTATMFQYNIKINFIFDSVATLFNQNSRYVELFNPPKKHKDKTRNAEEKYYQLLLKFGWNVNTDFPENIAGNLHPKQLASFAAASSSAVYMNYIKHNLTFNEDGSVSLSVEYIGSIESEARNANNVNAFESQDVKRLKEIQKEIDEKEAQLKQNESKLEINVQKSTGITTFGEVEITFSVNGSPYSGVSSVDAEYLKQKYEQKYKLENNSLDSLLETIINNIGYQYDNAFSHIQINKDSYDKAAKILEQNSTYSETEQIEKFYEWQRTIKDKNNVRLVTSEYLQKPEYFKGPHQVLTPSKYITNEYLSKIEKGSLDSDPYVDVYNIRYFTFGTLICALSSMNPDYFTIATNCNINLAGESGFLSAREFKETESGKKILIDSGVKVDDSYVVLENKVLSVNIFDIPIALSTFRYWFLKNVTSQNLTSMTLLNFLNLCVNELLILAIRSDNNDYVPKQNIKFKYFFDKVDIDNNNILLKRAEEVFNLKENFLEGRARKYPDDRRDNNDNTEAVSLFSNSLNSQKTTKKVIIFYSVPTYVQRVKNMTTDIEDGIPHFFYGAANSIANKITFRDEDIPFYREANIQSQVDRKPWHPGVFLRGKYNVVIDTIGTVNFRVGSMFYVSPTFTGVIDPNEPIEYGIGGYFVLVSIKMSIESGKYITSLEGNWVSTGTGEYTDLTQKGYTIKKLSKPIEDLYAQQLDNQFPSEEEILQELINQGVARQGESLEDVVNRTAVVYTGSGKKVPRKNN